MIANDLEVRGAMLELEELANSEPCRTTLFEVIHQKIHLTITYLDNVLIAS